MIAHLHGFVAAREGDAAVIDVHGVGYLVGMTSRDLSRLPSPDAAEPLLIHVVTHFRDGAISLYGFLEASQREVFGRLIDISGVGPKLALAILSTLSVQQLWDAAMSGNYATLSHVRGVGPQKARKLMLELKDVMRTLRPSTLAAPTDASSSPPAPADVAAAATDAAPKKRGRKPAAAAPMPPPGAGILWQELRSALNNMGFADMTIEGTISDLQRDEPGAAPGDLDRLLREGLKRLRGVKKA